MNKNSGEQEKESIIRVRVGQKNPSSGDHCLSSLGKPRDAKWRSSEQIFVSYPHTRDKPL